jgi:hypothetical protein
VLPVNVLLETMLLRVLAVLPCFYKILPLLLHAWHPHLAEVQKKVKKFYYYFLFLLLTNVNKKHIKGIDILIF